MLRHIHLESCDSTQDELERRLEGTASPVENMLVSTSRQLQGRGRHDRVWEHVPGSLAFSFSCVPHPSLSWQSLEVAVHLATFLEEEFDSRVLLKWPNDLVAGANKCGGILLKHQGGRMLVGVGLNLLPHPTSGWGAALGAGTVLDRGFESRLPALFVERYLAASPTGPMFLKSEWEARCAHLGRPVTVSEGGHETQGIFLGLGGHGEALVDAGKGPVALYNGTLRTL